jgi:hypothetical protein
MTSRNPPKMSAYDPKRTSAVHFAGLGHHFFIIIVIRHESTAAARWALLLIVSTLFNDAITVAVWTGFHVCLQRPMKSPMIPLHESADNAVTSWILELEEVFRLQTVIRLCRPLQRTALLARRPCARQFFGNCPIRVDSHFCRAHPYTDKSRRCDPHSTLEGRTELGRPFERRPPRSASTTS